MDVRETPFPVHIKCNTLRKYSEKQKSVGSWVDF